MRKCIHLGVEWGRHRYENPSWKKSIVLYVVEIIDMFIVPKFILEGIKKTGLEYREKMIDVTMYGSSSILLWDSRATYKAQGYN